MNFISCVKTISMRIKVETLPFLVTEDSDIPLLGVANPFRAAILAKMGSGGTAPPSPPSKIKTCFSQLGM